MTIDRIEIGNLKKIQKADNVPKLVRSVTEQKWRTIEMEKKKREIMLGITAVLFVVFVGWMVYLQSYNNAAVLDNNVTVNAEDQQEEQEKKEKGNEKEMEDSDTEKEQEIKEAAAKEDITKEERAEKKEKAKELKMPKKLLALYSEKGASLSWKKVKNADGYLIFRREKDGELKELVETDKNSYIDETAKEKTAYRYRVCAVMKAGEEIFQGEKTKGTAYFHSEIDPEKPMVALTFDDGPSIYTKEILKTLKKYNARATFFIVGERVSSYKDTIKQASKQGCEIGSHSYSHANLGTASLSTIDSELSKTEEKIKDILGYYTPVMRPPYGSVGTKLREYIEKPMILWSIDTLDWKTRNAKSTETKIMSSVKDGDIVLMHDLYSQSKDAAIKVIPKLIKKGYQIVTVSEMAKYKGFTMKNGETYTDMKQTKKS